MNVPAAAALVGSGQEAPRQIVPSCSLAPKNNGGSVPNCVALNDVSRFMSASTNVVGPKNVAPSKEAIPDKVARSNETAAEKVARSNEAVSENVALLNQAPREKVAPLKEAGHENVAASKEASWEKPAPLN